MHRCENERAFYRLVVVPLQELNPFVEWPVEPRNDIIGRLDCPDRGVALCVPKHPFEPTFKRQRVSLAGSQRLPLRQPLHEPAVCGGGVFGQTDRHQFLLLLLHQRCTHQPVEGAQVGGAHTTVGKHSIQSILLRTLHYLEQIAHQRTLRTVQHRLARGAVIVHAVRPADRFDRIQYAIRAGENRARLPRSEFRRQRLDSGRGVSVLVVKPLRLHGSACTALGDEALWNAIDVIPDYPICSAQDLVTATVVAAQYHPASLKRRGEAFHPTETKRRPKAVDALIIVAHHRHVGTRHRVQLYPTVLKRVRVLKLIDNQIGERVGLDLSRFHSRY